MASCLRSIYAGDPFREPAQTMPALPAHLRDQVLLSEQTVDGIRCAVYSPKAPGSRRPMILYMHGGGFVIGCSEDVDYITRTLSYQNNCVVVSVNYRLAPETVFPGALQDCEKVLAWALEHASELNIDSSNFFLAGDSAGGNIAASLAQILTAQERPVLGVIALAPWLDMSVESYDSYNSPLVLYLMPHSWVMQEQLTSVLNNGRTHLSVRCSVHQQNYHLHWF